MAETNLREPRTVYERRDDVQIVDVREPYEWEAGRVEGSIHIPLSELLSGRMDDLSSDRPVVAVCTVGQRSEVARLMLEARGFEAYNLEDGLKAWEAEGLPLTTPAGEPGRIV